MQMTVAGSNGKQHLMRRRKMRKRKANERLGSPTGSGSLCLMVMGGRTANAREACWIGTAASAGKGRKEEEVKKRQRSTID